MKDASPPPADLICPPERIFDSAAIRAALDAALADTPPEEGPRRRQSVDILSRALKDGRAAIAEGLKQHPFAAVSVIHSYSWLTDCITRAALDIATRHMHPLPTPTSSERIAIF